MLPNDPHTNLHLDNTEVIRNLFEQALSTKGDNAYFEFLSFVTRFNRHSIFNAMLIYLQRPGASAVGSPRQWAKMQRSINPDAIPIVILQPFGPVRFVYELGDTNGKEIPGHDSNPLQASGTLTQEKWERTVSYAKKLGVAIEKVKYGDNLAGTAATLNNHQDDIEKLKENDSENWRIRINSTHDLPSQFATLAHELGHIYCGHQGAHPKMTWPNRRGLDKNVREIEAETVSFLVCNRSNILTRSADYLRGYVTMEALTKIDIHSIMLAADRVEARGRKADKI